MKTRFVYLGWLFLILFLFGAAQVSAKTVTLSWDASPSTITGYRIYYAANSSADLSTGTGAVEGDSPIDVGNVLTYTLTGLADTDVHYFAVKAYESTNESVYSNVVESAVVTPGGGGSNIPPLLAPIGARSVAEGAVLNFTISASDADNDPLTYSAANLPAGSSFSAASQTFNWAPGFTAAGPYPVTFSVSDGTVSDSEIVTITVTETNRAPVLAPIGTKTVGEGSQLSFTISASDPDNDGLSYAAENLPIGASFSSSTRLFSWTPPFEGTDNTRVYPVIFSASDGSLSDSETVTINVTDVNRPPILGAIGPQSTTEGESFNLLINASDPDGDPLTYTVSNLPTGAVFTTATQSLSWIPGSNQAGTYQITFSVADGALEDSETVLLNVANANEAPVIAALESKVVSEGALLSFVVSATDPDNDALLYAASALPAGASFDAEQQLFSWTPDYTQAGNFTVNFSVSDGVFSDTKSVAISVVNSNQSPVISGAPATTVMATMNYSFTPVANDPDGDSLTFSISNKPAWASFDPATGQLSGTPSAAQTGATDAIAIGASDGTAIVFLSLFSVEVLAYEPIDSDGDGVLDALDVFPNDASEWLDTDGDLLGNNADSDDDGDGVADVRDGFPLDSTLSGWLINASAGAGGYITPEGETAVLFGGAQEYILTPMAGYYIADLQVDGISVGIRDRYQFNDVNAHHDIAAVFVPIPTGLSLDPTATGLAGVARVDGGDDSNNLVSGNPKLDINFRFQVILRESATPEQRRVFLVLDGYRYPMQLASGALSSGATYAFLTRLAPAFSHSFYYVSEDINGNQLWRFPTASVLPGPKVELLNGYNIIGVSAAIDSAGLDSLVLFNDPQVYRYVSTDRTGSFNLVNSGAAVRAGEGYLLRRTVDTMPNLELYGEVSASVYEIEIKPGWNLISNPYNGNISLAEVLVRHGSAEAVPWLSAVSNNLLVDGLYFYQGQDWGAQYLFTSAAGADPAILTPWTGYWVYVFPTEQSVSLLMPKPRQ